MEIIAAILLASVVGYGMYILFFANSTPQTDDKFDARTPPELDGTNYTKAESTVESTVAEQPAVEQAAKPTRKPRKPRQPKTT